MHIHSTIAPFRGESARKSFDRAQPSPDPGYSNTTPDSFLASAPKLAIAGATLGGAGLGLATQAAFGGFWGVAGAAVGAALGGYIGNQYHQLSYDAKGAISYLHKKAESNSRAEKYSESAGALTPLSGTARLANDPTGDIQRKFDSYDSSRNITGLLAEESKPDAPYRLALEMAHLRPLAEKDSLHTTFILGEGKKSLTISVDGDNAIEIDGQALTDDSIKVKHSVRFNQVIAEVNKDLLRERGWNDGQPLKLKAETRVDKNSAVFDEVQASSDQRVNERLFRWEGKTIYQIMTDRFENGDKTNDQDVDPGHPDRFHGGDWQGVLDRMDYLKDLGGDTIWLSCPYENDRDFFGSDGYHGYWPHDFREAEKSFGSKEKLKEVVRRAHEKGMKVMLDVVVNHTGYNHPGAKDPDFRDWFHRAGSRNPVSKHGLEHGSLAGLPDLAQENPEVSHYLIDVHKDWLTETDVDGFRVDAIRHVPEKFLQDFDSTMKAEKPGFVTIGEVFWNDPHYLAGYQNETQDSLFDFPLMQAVRDVFGSNPDQTLLERIEQFQEVKKHNFGQAIMDLTNKSGSSMQKLSKVLSHDHAYDNPRLLSTIMDNHDTGRFLSQAGGDKQKLKIASAFLYGVRGTPSIYYGTETGMMGQMPHNRKDMDFDGEPELREHFKSLIAMRRNSPALQLGTQQELAVTDDTYAFSRVLPGQEVLCLYNNGDESRILSVPITETQLADGDELNRLDQDGRVKVENGKVELKLPAKGYAFLNWEGATE